MTSTPSRRNLLKFASILFPVAALGLPKKLLGLDTPPSDSFKLPLEDIFPRQQHELVREMVTVSHFSLSRVKELVTARPSLARAAWDWGFGDWETALGASCHMGNKPIAEFLISSGARPSLFSAAMLGQLDVVKAFVAASPGVQRIPGPHSIPLLDHARAGGAAARPVAEFLQSLGDAGDDPRLVPLPESDVSLLVGTYLFGTGANQQIEVTFERGQLNWTRSGATGRALFHLGNRVFHPAGAAAVRIAFADNNGPIMTVNDPDLILTARKKPAAK